MTWIPKKHVVVPVDFSDDSFAAVDVALAMAAGPMAVHVVHVLPDLAVTEPVELWEAIDYGKMRERAETALRERLDASGAEGVRTTILIGDPGQAIADYAKEQHTDLIVLPSHGCTGWRRFLLGSVTERVVRLAECPVLVLKTPRHES
jgi:nucleotide-binding universal stress UspA family protein